MSLTPALRERIERYPWPGNVREAESVDAFACLLARGRRVLDVSDVSDAPSADMCPEEPLPAWSSRGSLEERLELVTNAAIAQEMRRYGGSRTEAASVLGISREWISRMASEHGLPAARGTTAR